MTAPLFKLVEQNGFTDLHDTTNMLAYARRLASYIKDPTTIRAHVRREYGETLPIERIRELQEAMRPKLVPDYGDDDIVVPLSVVAETKAVVRDEPKPKRRPIFINRAQRVLAAASMLTGIPEAKLLGHKRHQHYVRPRYAIAFVLREAGYSYPRIGAALGGRDHSTIIHAVGRAQDLLTCDMPFERMVFVLQRAARVAVVIGA